MKDGEKHRARHRPPAATCVALPSSLTSVSCPSCGQTVDLWSADGETRCFACGHAIFAHPQADH